MNSLEEALKQFMANNPDLPEGENNNAVEEPKPAKKRDKLQVVVERKGRGGKTATIITGFTSNDDEVATIARELKTRLGAGGSSRGGEILIQGDRKNDVIAFLKSKGLF